MKSARSAIIAILVTVALSLLVAGVASTAALARPRVSRLDTNLASALRADYSADPEGARLAPLDQRIVEIARQDEERLRDRSTDVEFVPVFWVSSSGDLVAGDGSDDSIATAAATPTRTPAPAPPGSTPTATPSPAPPPGFVPTPTPAPAPPPGSTATATPAPAPPPTCSAPDPLYGFVQSVTPADGATGVPVSTSIVIKFSQPMSASSVNTTNVYLTDGTSPAGLWVTVSYNANTYEATMIPDAVQNPLNPGANYYPAVWKGIKNACGTRQGVTISTAFSTAP